MWLKTTIIHFAINEFHNYTDLQSYKTFLSHSARKMITHWLLYLSEVHSSCNLWFFFLSKITININISFVLKYVCTHYKCFIVIAACTTHRASKVAISMGSVHSILYDDQKVQQMSFRWVLRRLMDNAKSANVACCQAMLTSDDSMNRTYVHRLWQLMVIQSWNDATA